MQFLEWCDRLELGHPQLDGEHRALIVLFNAIMETMTGAAPASLLMERIDALVMETLVHFDSEERLMRAASYPRLEPHQIAHRGLILQARIFRAAVADGLVRPEPPGLMFLRDWLLAHIDFADRPLAEFLRTRASGSVPAHAAA